VIADDTCDIVERFMPDLADRLPPKGPAKPKVMNGTPRKR